MCEQCHEKEFSIVRDAYSSFEASLKQMQSGSATGRTNLVFNGHKAIKSLTEMIEFYIQKQDDKFTDADFDSIYDTLEFYNEKADAILSVYKARVA